MPTTTSTVTNATTTIPDFLTITPLRPTTRPKSDDIMATTEIRQRQHHGTRHIQAESDTQPQPPSSSKQPPQPNKTTYHLRLPKEPLPKILEPLYLRITFFLRLWALKILGTLWLQYHHLTHPQPAHTKPDLIKAYPFHPNFPVHIFFPPCYNHNHKNNHDSNSPDRYPVHITLHPGGLTLGSPVLTHPFSRHWSTITSSIVLSLPYPLTPLHPFPTATSTLTALITTILTDPTLPLNPHKVTLSGTSAGGLLALSVSQHPSLRNKITSVVAVYPATDFSEYPATKFQRRLDVSRPWEALHALGGALDWGYVNPGQNRRDPILSPLYAEPRDLPANICIVGAQYDMFCREGRDLIFKLAGRELGEGEKWKEGFEAEIEGDGGRRQRYKWVYADGMAHGFTEVVGQKKGRGLERRQKYCEELYRDIQLWLENAVSQTE